MNLVAFRFITANEHPDHDTIAIFRRRFLKDIEGLFVRVLELAREMGVLKLGTVALDGTKIHANASRHSALSYGHASQIEALGSALWSLAERESGTARLNEAVAAYREALTKRTRDRVPLDWAMTQNNLGVAF